MIRYRWSGSPEHPAPIAFIGLSDANLARLREGLPISIPVDDDLGLGIEMVIYHGKDEVELTRELEQEGFMPEGASEAAAQAMAQRTSVGYRRQQGPARGGTPRKRA